MRHTARTTVAVGILGTVALLAATFAWGVAAQQDGQPQSPTSIDQAMLFRSFIQDASECEVTVEDGAPTFAPGLGSPAATCPDAFAWVQYLQAIRGEFWNWGIDQTVWPDQPLPICTGSDTDDCCPQDILDNPGDTPNESCPYNRQDFTPIPPLPVEPNGTPSGVVLGHRGAHKKTPVEELDPGRMLRDLEVELVFRNPSMVDYIFKNDMYTKEGLGARVRASNSAVAAGDIGTAQALEVRMATDATMVKADFLHENIMLGQGLIEDTDGDPATPPNNPEFPYLTVYLEGDEKTSGYYYMLAMTNASKALPDWHWYAMEHVANLGRCDYIGCNDSFGYSVHAEQPDGANFGGHYIPPMQELENDQLVTPNADPNNPIFVTGKVYHPRDTGETITPALEALFRGLGVATDAVDRDPKVISVTDPQWHNYRLKGTQTVFTTSHGVPTGTGATITEGGFVNSASCMTCHAQASTDENGNPGFGASVGASWRLNLFGFGQVEMGSPDLGWFFYPGTAQPFAAVQDDFIWGILNAQCVEDGSNGLCESYPDSPTIIE